jgi:low temperature requirement protein LtrA
VSAGLQNPARVSTLELFFDLVFVFTITQLTGVLDASPSLRGLLQVSLLLTVIWFMYGGYAWLTNAVAIDRLSRRLYLLAGMGSYLVLALAIPRAFSGTGAAFGLAYLAVVLVHATLFLQASEESGARGILRVGPVNVGTAVLVLLGGTIGGTAEYVLLATAGAIQWLAPLATARRGFSVGAAHFVERHGLVVLIAIGESVVAVGIGAEHLAIDLRLVVVAVPGPRSRPVSGGRTSAATIGAPSVRSRRRPPRRAPAWRSRRSATATC